MATNSRVYVKDNGNWKVPKSIFVKNAGSWTTVKKVWINVNGVWKEVVPPSQTIDFTSSGSFVVPTGVNQLYLSGIGGGGSAGNVVDGGRNDDYGGSGGGSGGQKIADYLIPVTPGETISVTIGGAGSRAYGGRDSNNQGGTGGTTFIYTAAATYYLLGGTGGYGGVGGAGSQYSGSTQTTANTSFTFGAVTVDGGQNSQSGVGGYGGAGFSGSRKSGGSQGGGSQINDYLNASDYGGGGAGIWSNYIREDNGNSPAWGGLGKAGFARFYW